ncbi:putative dynein intermediate chain 3, ciliary [Operophtera brumata]|uniref:Putative dynein intermediate chain 3, ciliary n=1 Tax=Operophtera brumata TaxID=104452 RepID=A0A0L7LRR5_OPEBR|nr:putative dynein intermediate chain 3, ciliary [Operophtera brumata]
MLLQGYPPFDVSASSSVCYGWKLLLSCYEARSSVLRASWDTRNMSEPTDSMIIDLVKLPTDTASIENAIGISALEYEPTIPTRYLYQHI